MYTTNYELLDPVAPSFSTPVSDFIVVIGFDKTFSFSTIDDGSHTPVTFTIAATVLSPSQYTFDANVRTIILHGSQSSFDSLAGTTLTLTSTLSHAYATSTFTQTVTIAAYVPPTTTPIPLADFSFQNGVAETKQVMTFIDGSFPVAT